MEPCCEKDENRRVLPQERPDLRIEQCAVCLRKHYELTLDPARLGMQPAGLG